LKKVKKQEKKFDTKSVCNSRMKERYGTRAEKLLQE
jgi:hypothetical protein